MLTISSWIYCASLKYSNRQSYILISYFVCCLCGCYYNYKLTYSILWLVFAQWYAYCLVAWLVSISCDSVWVHCFLCYCFTFDSCGLVLDYKDTNKLDMLASYDNKLLITLFWPTKTIIDTVVTENRFTRISTE